jgi:hypothetical protein
MGIQQMGYGINDCGTPLGDDAFILASLDESSISICDDIHRLIGGISGLSFHAAFSVAYHSCMQRASHLAGAFNAKLTKYFCAKIDDKSSGRSRLHSERISSPPLQMTFLTPPSSRTVHSCLLG